MKVCIMIVNLTSVDLCHQMLLVGHDILRFVSKYDPSGVRKWVLTHTYPHNPPMEY